MQWSEVLVTSRPLRTGIVAVLVTPLLPVTRSLRWKTFWLMILALCFLLRSRISSLLFHILGM